MREYTNEELAELAQWAEAGEQESGNQIRTPRGPVGTEGTIIRMNTDKRKAYGAIRQGVDWLLRVRILERQQKVESMGSAPELVEGMGRKPT